MKPKTKSELMAEWASQPDQLKKEREVKAVRKRMNNAFWMEYKKGGAQCT